MSRINYTQRWGDMPVWSHCVRKTCTQTHTHIHTVQDSFSTVGQPITGAACGGGEQGEQEEVERDEKCCSTNWGIWGLKDPDAHQLLMLNSESDHCLSVGLECWRVFLTLLPPPRHPTPFLIGSLFLPNLVSFPSSVGCCAQQTESTLMDIFCLYLSTVLLLFVSHPLSLHAAHS